MLTLHCPHHPPPSPAVCPCSALICSCRHATAPRRLLDRLDALTVVLSYCRGWQCGDPWGVLHPDGGVLSLDDAMNPYFDPYYAALPKFKYKRCATSYDPRNEDSWWGTEAWEPAPSFLPEEQGDDYYAPPPAEEGGSR